MKIFVFSLAIILLSSCSGANKEDVSQGQKLPPIVNAQKVTYLSPGTENIYSGVLAPATEVDLAFRVGGYIDYIGKRDGRVLQEGDFVHKGEVLARTKQDDANARVTEQQAALSEVVASDERSRINLSQGNVELEQAREDFNRSSRLFEKDCITKPEFDAAKTKLKACQTRVDDAQAQLQINNSTKARVGATLSEAKLTVRDTTLKAPMDGIVLKRNIEEGSLVGAGTVGFTIGDTKSVKANFGVPDVVLAKLKMGDPVLVHSEAFAGEMFQGKISDLGASADAKTRVFNVEVRLNNTSGKLRSGMIVALHLDDAKSNEKLAAIPLTAVVRQSAYSKAYEVFVLKKEGDKTSVEERLITIGDTVGQMVTVVKGLEPDDIVVTNGSTRIASGQEVRVSD